MVMFPGALTRIAVVAAVCAATVVNGTRPGGAAGTEKRPVPDPTVSGPIPGEPASLSAVDLGPRGYVEEEYFVEGTARAYEPAGPLTEDGRWNVQTTTTAPYRTRVLVRRPKDPAKFNGVVEVEWLNVSGGLDAAPDWGLGNAELLRAGFAWVGVSAQAVGVNSLKNNPARYGTLDHPGDAYSYDIYSQVGEALRSPHGHEPTREPSLQDSNDDRRRRVAVRVPHGHVRQRHPAADRDVRRLLRAQPVRGGRADHRRRTERDPESDVDPSRHEEAGARARIGDGCPAPPPRPPARQRALPPVGGRGHRALRRGRPARADGRSEEHTSELQSHSDLVCRLLLEKKKKKINKTLCQKKKKNKKKQQ